MKLDVLITQFKSTFIILRIDSEEIKSLNTPSRSQYNANNLMKNKQKLVSSINTSQSLNFKRSNSLSKNKNEYANIIRSKTPLVSSKKVIEDESDSEEMMDEIIDTKLETFCLNPASSSIDEEIDLEKRLCLLIEDSNTEKATESDNTILLREEKDSATSFDILTESNCDELKKPNKFNFFSNQEIQRSDYSPFHPKQAITKKDSYFCKPNTNVKVKNRFTNSPITAKDVKPNIRTRSSARTDRDKKFIKSPVISPKLLKSKKKKIYEKKANLFEDIIILKNNGKVKLIHYQ